MKPKEKILLILWINLPGLIGSRIDFDQVIGDQITTIAKAKFPHQDHVDIVHFFNQDLDITEGLMSQGIPLIMLDNEYSDETIPSMIHDRSKVAVVLSKADPKDNVDIKRLMNIIFMKANSFIVLYGTEDPSFLGRMPENTEKEVLYIRFHKDFHSNRNASIYVACPNVHARTFALVNVILFGKVAKVFSPNCLELFQGDTVKIAYTLISRPYLYLLNGNLAGHDFEMMNYIAERFNFLPKLILAKWGTFEPGKGQYTQGAPLDFVLRGNATFAIGAKGMEAFELAFVDAPNFPITAKFVLISRNPIPLKSIYQFFWPFSLETWISCLIALVLLSLMMMLTYLIYQELQPFEPNLIVKAKVSYFDFLLLPFSRFVEPDPLPWFKSYSTGKFLVFLWSISTMLIIFSYTCNLRAHIASKRYEKRVDTIGDALERDQNIYSAHALSSFNHLAMKSMGIRLSEELERFSQRIHENNGWINLLEHGGMYPGRVYQDLQENGAVLVHDYFAHAHDYIQDKSKGLPNFSTSKSFERNMFISFFVRKNAPYMEELNAAVGQWASMGFAQRAMRRGLPQQALMPWNPKQEQSKLEPLGINAFVLLGLLALTTLPISTVVFLLERSKYGRYLDHL